MSGTVLDTSALLAYLTGETGVDRIEAVIEAGAAVSALSVQEAVSKLVQRGLTQEDAEEAIVGVGLVVHDLIVSLAVVAGGMFSLTRRYGLSHGDRACLVLGRVLGRPVLTQTRYGRRWQGRLGWRSISSDSALDPDNGTGYLAVPPGIAARATCAMQAGDSDDRALVSPVSIVVLVGACGALQRRREGAFRRSISAKSV